MMFLNPAVLIGLAAASIPVILHLLNLRKLKRIEFSTLRFLKELQKQRIRKLRMKQWLLLALRVLAVVFLVLAFARPALEEVSISGITSAAKTTSVIIIDDSPSMAVIGKGGSYLNQAKAAAMSVINRMKEGDEAAVILLSDLFGDPPTLVSSTDELKKQIENAEVSAVSGTLESGIGKAARLLGESRNFNKELYIFSDFQKSRLDVSGTPADYAVQLNNQMRVFLMQPETVTITNASVSAINLNTSLFEKGKTVSVTADIRNHSSSSIGRTVSLFLAGERIAQKNVTVDAEQILPVELEGRIGAAGYLEITVALDEDAVPGDDRRTSVVYVPEKTTVMILSDTESDTRFLKLALQAAAGASSMEILTASMIQAHSLDYRNLSCVVLVGSEQFPVGKRLQEFVENGGGLVIFPGNNSSLVRFNAMLSALGLPAAGELKQQEKGIGFGQPELTHPLFAGLFGQGEKKQFESPDVYRYFPVTLKGVGKTVIPLLGGNVFLSEFKRGNGKILFYAAAPTAEASSMPLKSIFVPLMVKSVLYAAAQELPEYATLTGDEIVIPSGSVSGQMKVVQPDGAIEVIPSDAVSGGFLRYRNTRLQGNYAFFNGAVPLAVIPVNLPPAESETEYLTSDEVSTVLQKYGSQALVYTAADGAGLEQAMQRVRFGSELWRVFLLAALICLMLELMISRTAKKDLAAVTAAA